jgi:tetraacyldisaccharide 4'-kinase
MVSRGYGSQDGRPNDEALELAEKLPGVPHVQDADRVRGARRVIREFGCQLLVLDDGFQHRRLKRDFDLVLIDALEPYGFEHVFPRGTLREPLAGWARASAFLLTRADQVDEPTRAAIRARAMSFAPQAVWAEAAYVPRYLLDASGEERPLEAFAGKSLVAFCGIGNPDAFRRSLADAGLTIAAMRALADHYDYRAAEVVELAAWADGVGAAAAVCTYKDLVKVRGVWPVGVPLVALASRLEITSGQAELEAALLDVIAAAKAS